MLLQVDPAAVLSYAGQVERAHQDSLAVRRYVTQHAHGGTGGELFAIAQEGHTHAVAVLDGTLNRLACVLETCPPELRAAGTYYARTDLAAAAAMDRT